ncbi:uncharacterized protein LOC133173578 [Saccostrea echinata]|uniref:uncharacterized protein LOC133173578 n=1 Tax=Saccostrea echinata TaxID=191078 RepID=UPI002A7FF64A|nr:uncharacterized protein LOC133173578 [Saccostrea echinata]
MYEEGKTAQIAAEMRNYNLTLLGIRVALVLSKTAREALIGWEAHGPRIIRASFKTKHKRIKTNIIQCYAPTNDAEEEAKDEFYNRLQSVIDTCRERDVTIMMGDLNAKIGNDNTGYGEIMGKHGLGQMNENGERLANFCASNKQVIGGTLFQHKRIHKATWVSPDQLTENQIDHICINKKFRRSLQDTRVKRAADVASDHHLLTGSIKLKLRKMKTEGNSQRIRYNTRFLQDTQILQEYKIAVKNKYQVLQEKGEVTTFEDHWKGIKETITTSCHEILGVKKYHHKEWITNDTLRKVQERKAKKAGVNSSRTRAEKAKAQKEYAEANKRTKQATEAEQAAKAGTMKDLYDITKKLAGKRSKQERPVKDKAGKQLEGEEEQRRRWKEHFEELLNRPVPPNPPNITPADEDLDIDWGPPTKEEIKIALKLLRLFLFPP